MSIKCLFGHQWNGCKCSRCGKTHDKGHNYVVVNGQCIDKCTVCGKERNIEHKWKNGKCTKCGTNLFDNADVVGISGVIALVAGMGCFKEEPMLRIGKGIAQNIISGCNFTKEETEYIIVCTKIIIDLWQGGTISEVLNNGNNNHPSPEQVIINIGNTFPKLFTHGESIGYKPVLDVDTFLKYTNATVNNGTSSKTSCEHTLEDSKCTKCTKTIEEIVRTDLADTQWSMSGNSQSKYYSKKADSLVEASEILKQLSSIPPMTYYLVDTPDGTLGRDVVGFFTESPLKTKGIQTKYGCYGKSGASVEAQSMKNYGDDMLKVQSTVATLKASGQYAELVLMMKCGQCGYESPVETHAGDLERACYFCGTNNKTHRGEVNVYTMQGMVKI